MAASIKHIITQGMILDTILHSASQAISGLSPYAAVILIFLFTLLIEFFIASGSAKAFLLIPIMIPLAEMVGISTRQVTVSAYCFGATVSGPWHNLPTPSC